MGEHIRKILILKVFVNVESIQFVKKDLGFPKAYLHRQVITIEKRSTLPDHISS